MAKKYTLTDEHRAQLKPWADRWIENALSTEPMTEADRAVMRRAVRGLYEAAKLEPPPDHRVVFVPSPFVARVAAGFAAAIWHLRKKGQSAATEAATRDATAAATYDATRAATDAATEAATRDATEAATRDATYDATYAATTAATDAATGDSWFVGMGGLSQMARCCVPGHERLAVRCAYEAYQFWQGGNQWSAWVAFLSFFRHVARLPLDYSKWAHYEDASIHAGPRMMHAEFCIISDRPRVLTVDGQSRPHNATGPFCRWADMTALYAWHGVRVPWWVIEQPERITPQRIQQEANAEIRRAMIERIGWDVWLTQSGAQPTQADAFGALYRTELDGERIGIVVVDNSTPEPDGSVKRYGLLVPPEHQTARAAVASTFGLTAAEYAPAVET